MAENRFYLVIEDRSGGPSNNSEDFDTPNNFSNSSSSGTGNDHQVSTGSQNSQGGSGSGAAAKAYFAGQAIKLAIEGCNEILAWAQYFYNENLILTDNYIEQRQVRVATQIISRTSSIVNNVGESAMQGAMAGGAIGAVVGAVVGLILEGSRSARENVEGMRQQNIMLAQMDAQLDYTRQRAGWSTKAASIGEDL